MIVGFADKNTEAFWLTGKSRQIPADVQKRAYARLQALHAAKEPKDLLVPPGNQLEALKGNRRNQHSIRVNKQWHICFIWKTVRPMTLNLWIIIRKDDDERQSQKSAIPSW
jgi:proteic killer suppression protein